MSTKAKLSSHLLYRVSAFDDGDLGPHAQAVWQDFRGAAAAGLPLAVVVLAALMVDVVQHEDAGPAGYIDHKDFSFAGNKAALAWLRRRRNAISHYEQPTDGLMGEADAACWLTADAEHAITTILDYLKDLKFNGKA